MELPLARRRHLLVLASATAITVALIGEDDDDPLLKYSQVHIYCSTTAFISSLLVILILKSSRQLSKGRIKYRVLQAAVALDLSGLLGAYASESFHSIKTTFSIMALLAPALFCVGVEALPFLCKHVGKLLRAAHTRLVKNIPRSDVEIIVSVQGNSDAYEILSKSHTYVFLLSVCGACVTYRAGLETPGGFWAGSDPDIPDDYLAGGSVLASHQPGWYLMFFCCNTAAFISSITNIIRFVRYMFSSKEINYLALQVVMLVQLFGMIGAFGSISLLLMGMDGLIEVVAVPLLLCTVIFMLQAFPPCAPWRRALGDRIKQCVPGWLNKLFEPPNMERNSENLRNLMQAFAVAVVTTMYILCMDPPVVLLEEDSEDYSVWRYVAFSYLNATSFLASMTIIMLLVNRKLPASGIRWYALWVSGILCLICFLGNHVVTHIYWKVPIFRDEAFLVMFLCGTIADMEMIHEVRKVVVGLADGEDIAGLEDDGSDGEMQIGLAGGGPNEEPLSLEISSSILGGAITLALAVPARDSLYNPLQVVGAFVTATIVSAVWRRFIAPLLLRLTGDLQRRYGPTQGSMLTASSSTPQPRTTQAFCHGLCKVIRTFCSGSWVWIITLWVLSVKPNLGMKFKISKLTSLLDVFLGAGGTPAVTVAPSTTTATVTAVATTSGHNNRLVVESRPRRNRRPNNRLVGPDWVN